MEYRCRNKSKRLGFREKVGWFSKQDSGWELVERYLYNGMVGVWWVDKMGGVFLGSRVLWVWNRLVNWSDFEWISRVSCRWQAVVLWGNSWTLGGSSPLVAGGFWHGNPAQKRHLIPRLNNQKIHENLTLQWGEIFENTRSKISPLAIFRNGQKYQLEENPCGSIQLHGRGSSINGGVWVFHLGIGAPEVKMKPITWGMRLQFDPRIF